MNAGEPIPIRTAALIPFAVLAFGSACSPPETVEVTETRHLSKYEPKPVLDAPANDRLWSGTVLSACPHGWVEDPPGAPAESRIISFSFGEKGEGNASLSVLQSREVSDFVTPNIQRWRTQIAQPPLGEEEIQSLPEVPLFGKPAKKITIDGNFKPVGKTKPKPGYRLVGAILQIPQFTFFVKMTGPKSLVAAEEANFDEFTSALKFR